MKKIALAFLSICLLAACNNTSPETKDSSETEELASVQLRKEVMELHDKVMPEMTPMSKLQGQLSQAAAGRADSLEIMTAATDLKYAKDAMMMWMRDFSNNFDDSWTEEEKVAFFEEEKAKMERIDTKTQEALKQGALVLEALEAESAALDSVSAE